jgi:molybdopterin molybdotransferase
MPSKKSTVSVAQAQQIIMDSVTPLEGESISILEAYHRVLYEDIVSDTMIPPLDCSAMDGYAIIAEDAQGASRENPAALRIVGEAQAGGSLAGRQISRGEAIRIMTGAAMPAGADAVIKVEDTEEGDGYVKIFRETAKYKNYRNAGENIRKGDLVLSRGDRLSSADIGILASLNRQAVEVYRQPRVAIISTGDELVGIGEEVGFGKIRDVNAYALYSEVKKYHALPEYLGIAKDTLRDVKEVFSRALEYDVVISTGGASMGRYDFIKEVYSDLNIETQFEWVNVKPGKPCAFAKKGGKLFFGLPGNPVSALTSFIQFVRPALLRLMGAKMIRKPIVSAVLEEDIGPKQLGKIHLLRGYFTIKDNEFFVSTTGDQKSSVFRSMSKANCLIIIPASLAGAKAGEKVEIQLIDHEEIW